MIENDYRDVVRKRIAVRMCCVGATLIWFGVAWGALVFASGGHGVHQLSQDWIWISILGAPSACVAGVIIELLGFLTGMRWHRGRHERLLAYCIPPLIPVVGVVAWLFLA